MFQKGLVTKADTSIRGISIHLGYKVLKLSQQGSFMRCRYCGESDESRLIMSTRNVNGKVETIDICLSCFWIERFKAEVKGEDGSVLREECERADNTVPARSLNSLGLQE